MEKIVELKPIKETSEDFDEIEKRIKELFKREIYFPLLRELSAPKTTLSNAKDSVLLEAIRSGRITFSRGVFSGKFNAGSSKALRDLGAKWDKKTSSFKITQSSLTPEIREAIAASETRFQQRLEAIDKKLSQLVPEEIAKKLKVTDAFDRTLWKTDKSFASSVKAITISPKLSAEQRKRIASEWQNNMHLWIQEFTAKETKELRSKIQQTTFEGNRYEGNRYEGAIKTIQDSFGVSARKAKFLARQETSLLMTKFKQTRYQDAGVHEYKWGCVHRPKDKSPAQHTPGNVRYFHGVLEGKIFRWDKPPIVDQEGSRKNPGQDYNCRCFAIPVVRFRDER